MKKKGNKVKSKTPASRIKQKKILRILLLRTSEAGVAFWPEDKPFRLPECQVIAPLGVLYLASVIRREIGRFFEVQVESLSTAVKNEEEIPAWLSTIKPDILALSSMTLEEDTAIKVVDSARRARDDTIIILGGPYPTYQPEESLKRTGADLIVRGEAETVIAPLLKTLRAGRKPHDIPGVSFMKNGRCHHNPPPPPVDPLDTLPFPAWDSIPIETYSGMYNMNGLPVLKSPYVPLLTSRGCPYRCSFCHNLFGRKFRPRSPENVLDEMELLYEKHGVREFHFVDDIFNLHKKRVEEICHGIIRRGLNISFNFANGIRGDILTQELIKLMKEAGCYCMCLSLESASPRILGLMRKKLNIKKLEEIARFASSIDIITKCIFMVGYPSETREEMEETLRWVMESSFDLLQHSIACPLPGTEMERHAAEFNPSYRPFSGHAMNYNVVRNLTTMDDEEFKNLLSNGVAEILSFPRRAKRIREIRQWWGPEAERYFDWTLSNVAGGFPVRGGKTYNVHLDELKLLAEGLLSSDGLRGGWKIEKIADSIVYFRGPAGKHVNIQVMHRDSNSDSFGLTKRYKLIYIPGTEQVPDLGAILEDIARAFRHAELQD